MTEEKRQELKKRNKEVMLKYNRWTIVALIVIIIIAKITS